MGGRREPASTAGVHAGVALPWTMRVCLYVLLILCCRTCGAQNATNAPTVQDGVTSAPAQLTTLEKAVEPIYTMTNYFLEKILYKDEAFPFKIEDFRDETINSFQDVIKILQDNYAKILGSHYVGYLICIAIGLLYILFMPIVGFIVCCCRVCCKKCGGKVEPQEGKMAKCERITCGLLLFLFMIVVLLGAVAMFLVNTDLNTKLTDTSNINAVTKMEQSVADLEAYIDNKVITGVNDGVIGTVEDTKTDIFKQLDRVAQETQKILGSTTSITDIIEKSKALASIVENIKSDLDNVVESTQNLETTSGVLAQNLTDLRNSTSQTLKNCPPAQCNNITSDISDLQTNANFSKVDNVQNQLNNFEDILNANFSDFIQQGEAEYNKITGRIRNETSARIEDFKKEAEKLVTEAKNTTNDLLDRVQGIQSSLRSVRGELKNTVQPQVNTYEKYRFYAFLGISILVLLIILMYCLGLMVGIMGDPPNVPNTCNRGKGATILMGGVYCTFLFTWILMIVVLILFIIFGLILNNEVCYPVSQVVENPAAVTKGSVAEIVDYSMSQVLSNAELASNVSVITLLSNCKQDKPLYTVLEPFIGQDLDKMLNLDDFQITDRIYELINKTNIDLSDIQVLNNETRQQLNKTSNSELENINFTSFFSELDKTLTKINLQSFQQKLLNISAELKNTAASTGNSSINMINTTAYEFEQHAKTVQKIQEGAIKQMETDKSRLKETIIKLENTANGNGNNSKSLTSQTNDLIKAFEDAQTSLTTNGSRIIQENVKIQAESILNKVNSTLISARAFIKSELAPCGPVYTSLKAAVNVVCDYVLDPINGFWFCLAACLIFFIPNIIFAAKLGSLYQKSEPYEPDSGFDKGDYELYSRRGSHRRKHGNRDYRDDNSEDTDHLVDNRNNLRNDRNVKKKEQLTKSKTPVPKDSRNGHVRADNRRDRNDDRSRRDNRDDRNSYMPPQNTRPYSQYAANRYDDNNYPPPEYTRGYDHQPSNGYDARSHQQNGYQKYGGNSYANRSYDDYSRGGNRYNNNYPNSSYGGDSYRNQRGYADRAGYGGYRY